MQHTQKQQTPQREITMRPADTNYGTYTSGKIYMEQGPWRKTGLAKTCSRAQRGNRSGAQQQKSGPATFLYNRCTCLSLVCQSLTGLTFQVGGIAAGAFLGVEPGSTPGMPKPPVLAILFRVRCTANYWRTAAAFRAFELFR